MALTERDILALRDILLPPITAQLADLKDAMNRNAETAQLESEKHRNGIIDLYELSRAQATEISQLKTQIATLESWKADHIKAAESEGEEKRWSKGQTLGIVAVSIPAALWVIDQVILMFKSIGGKS